MSQSAVVDGQPRSANWLRRHGLRRCQTCGQAKKTGSFKGERGRKCQSCRRAKPPRKCCVCQQVKPGREFGRRCQTCRSCSEIPYGSARLPRACLRCWIVKPPTDFDLSPRSEDASHARRRRGVCKVCLDEEAAARAARAQELAARRRTWDDPITGVTMRRCCTCEEEKVLDENFYVEARDRETGEIVGRSYNCKPCQIARASALLKKRREDPITGPAVRAQYAAYQRASRKRNPVAYKAAQERWRRNRDADPEKRAAYLENARIRYRLKREREGHKPRFNVSTATMGADLMPRLPAQPLGELIFELAQNGDGLTGTCAGLRVDPRNVFAWRTGERESVQFDVADRVLTASARTWWEVWPLDEYPDVHDLMFGRTGERESVLAVA